MAVEKEYQVDIDSLLKKGIHALPERHRAKYSGDPTPNMSVFLRFVSGDEVVTREEYMIFDTEIGKERKLSIKEIKSFMEAGRTVLGRKPNSLGEAMKATEIIRMRGLPLSLEKSLGEGTYLSDFIADAGMENAQESEEQKKKIEALNRALDTTLSRRARVMLSEEFGLNGSGRFSQREIGERNHGVSKQRVNQIKQESLKTLRKALS